MLTIIMVWIDFAVAASKDTLCPKECIYDCVCVWKYSVYCKHLVGMLVIHHQTQEYLIFSQIHIYI